MFKKEISTWALLLFATLLGSIATVTLPGCTPPPIDVDTSTDVIDDVDSNMTDGGGEAVDTPMTRRHFVVVTSRCTGERRGREGGRADRRPGIQRQT